MIVDFKFVFSIIPRIIFAPGNVETIVKKRLLIITFNCLGSTWLFDIDIWHNIDQRTTIFHGTSIKSKLGFIDNSRHFRMNSLICKCPHA